MRSTTKLNESLSKEKKAIDTPELMQMLSCGRSTAVKVGTEAKARVQIGKRVLWNANRIQEYLDKISI
ncbi:MAG: hypothetical protein IJ526_12745 [Lachnospiraceae bacterium]|nr:hypothetical protein [Lachnospiraceae bacterium]